MGVRKSQASLTQSERAAFIAAVLALKANGVYDSFVAQHRTAFLAGPNDPAHNGPGFFPWHREYLRRFERALQSVDPGVSLPYWDWTVDNSPNSSIWDANFLGGNGSGPPSWRVTTGPFAQATGQWTLTVLDPGETRPFLMRRFGGMGRLPTPQEVDTALNVAPYDRAPWHFQSAVGATNGFRAGLEGSTHNNGHMWVGGSMMSMSSPNDPVFWLHHCNIDRLWAEWQVRHPNEGYLPPSGTPGVVAGHALDDPMPPWHQEPTPPTPRGVLDHHSLGYEYDTETARWQPFHSGNDRLVTLAVGQNQDGRLEVFGAANDQSLWHTYQTAPNNGWSAWEPFHSGNDRLIRLAVKPNADGRLEVFGIAGDESLWHTYQTAPNNGWNR